MVLKDRALDPNPIPCNAISDGRFDKTEKASEYGAEKMNTPNTQVSP